MGYQLWMHQEIRDWLTGLRRTEPELARLVGEAVLALIDAGQTLGPPLVVPLGSALRPPEDPRQTLDYAYQRQLEMLTQVRRGVADVATSRKRIELTVGHLEQQATALAGQRGHAFDTGHDDQAREAGTREAGIQARLSQLRRQLDTLAGDEEEADHGQPAPAGQGRAVPGAEGDDQGELYGRRSNPDGPGGLRGYRRRRQRSGGPWPRKRTPRPAWPAPQPPPMNSSWRSGISRPSPQAAPVSRMRTRSGSRPA